MVARFLNAFHDLQASMTTSLLPVAAFFAAGAAAGAASFALRLGGIDIWLGTAKVETSKLRRRANILNVETFTFGHRFLAVPMPTGFAPQGRILA